MYRSTRAPRVFTAREATSSRECIMNQLMIVLSAMLLVTVFAADALVQHENFDRGRLEGDVGVPAKHSAGQKSGAVPDTPTGSSKLQSKIETANWNSNGLRQGVYLRDRVFDFRSVASLYANSFFHFSSIFFFSSVLSAFTGGKRSRQA